MIEIDNPEVHGMRAENFKRMTEGYHGTIARHGNTLIISIPFDKEIVAKNAEEWIVGAGAQEDSPINEVRDIIATLNKDIRDHIDHIEAKLDELGYL